MERFGDEVDVLIVGGGLVGLFVVCKFKLLVNEQGKELRVCLVEKVVEIGNVMVIQGFINTCIIYIYLDLNVM